MHIILKVKKREKKSYKKYLRATDDFFFYLHRIFRRNIHPSCSVKMWVRNTLQNEVECQSVETEI